MKAFRDITVLVTGIIIGCAAIAALHTRSADASTVVRSRSNITNNRMASPIGTSPQGHPSDTIVLCESCAYPSMPEEGCLILMDSQSGEIYAYCDDAMVGKGKPRHLGRLKALGEPIVPALEPPK